MYEGLSDNQVRCNLYALGCVITDCDPDIILGAAFGEDVALRLGLSEGDLAEGRRVMAEVSAALEALALAAQGVTAMHDVNRGGLLETLLEIAYLSKVGIEVESARLPIPAIVLRFAHAFRFDPLRMISSGTLAVTVPPERMEDVSHTLEESGTEFAFVGQVVEGTGVRVLQNGKTVHYTKIRCEEDDPARMRALYPRDG
jgi:hydrogenase expression/formation protein HypE